MGHTRFAAFARPALLPAGLLLGYAVGAAGRFCCRSSANFRCKSQTTAPAHHPRLLRQTSLFRAHSKVTGSASGTASTPTLPTAAAFLRTIGITRMGIILCYFCYGFCRIILVSAVLG